MRIRQVDKLSRTRESFQSSGAAQRNFRTPNAITGGTFDKVHVFPYSILLQRKRCNIPPPQPTTDAPIPIPIDLKTPTGTDRTYSSSAPTDPAKTGCSYTAPSEADVSPCLFANVLPPNPNPPTPSRVPHGSHIFRFAAGGGEERRRADPRLTTRRSSNPCSC